MKVFVVALALGVVLAAGPSYAQAPAPQTQKPATPTAPAGQAPAPRPAAPAAAPQTPPAAPNFPKFQDGMKYGYVNIQQVAAFSAEGKSLADKAKALNDQKVQELNGKNKALQTAQQKLEQGGSVLNDAARAQLQADIERQQRDIQRFTEDAQQDVQSLQQQLQDDFMRKLTPVIDKVAKEKQLHLVFSAADAGLIWAEPGLDLTGDVIKAFDASASAGATAAPAPTAKPATPAR